MIMNKELAFRNFYKSTLIHTLEKVENERKTTVRKIVLTALIAAILCPALFILYIELGQEYFLIPGILLLIVAPVYINFLLGDTKFYNNFKDKIIYKIIHYINPSFEYENDSKVDDLLYDNSLFFENKETIIYGDDHIKGTIKNKKVEFSELVVEFTKAEDKKINNSKFQFRGLFFVAFFNENFENNLLIKSANHFNDTNMHTMPQFEDLFIIKTFGGNNWIEDNIKLKNALIELQAKVPLDFMVSFSGNKMFIGVVHDEDLFEPTLFQSILNFDEMKGFFDDLYHPLHFIEVFANEFN